MTTITLSRAGTRLRRAQASSLVGLGHWSHAGPVQAWDQTQDPLLDRQLGKPLCHHGFATMYFIQKHALICFHIHTSSNATYDMEEANAFQTKQGSICNLSD